MSANTIRKSKIGKIYSKVEYCKIYYIMYYSKQYIMNSDSDNSQIEHQLKIEKKLNGILDKIKDYLESPKKMIYQR